MKQIVLTGGPCAGKTSIMSYLRSELADHGIRMINTPEAARSLMEAGLQPQDPNFQDVLLKLQIAQENILSEAAAMSPAKAKTVVIHDRGLMDNKAYCTSEQFQALLARQNLNEVSARDLRYDAVIHLVTAANGAEAFYAQDGVRQETVDEARALDLRTQSAWVGHPHLRIVDNKSSFETKKRRVLREILALFGLPEPIEIERKYLLFDNSILARMPADARKVDIVQHYLPSKEAGVSHRIRSRGENGAFLYTHTTKTDHGSGHRLETERTIQEDEFHKLEATAYATVRKTRWCFIHEHQYLELDDFSPMKRRLLLLKVELTDVQDEPILPDWIGPHKDVTSDKSLRNENLAIRRRP